MSAAIPFGPSCQPRPKAGTQTFGEEQSQLQVALSKAFHEVAGNSLRLGASNFPSWCNADSAMWKKTGVRNHHQAWAPPALPAGRLSKAVRFQGLTEPSCSEPRQPAAAAPCPPGAIPGHPRPCKVLAGALLPGCHFSELLLTELTLWTGIHIPHPVLSGAHFRTKVRTTGRHPNAAVSFLSSELLPPSYESLVVFPYLKTRLQPHLPLH
jgi:hypothetical protein